MKNTMKLTMALVALASGMNAVADGFEVRRVLPRTNSTGQLDHRTYAKWVTATKMGEVDSVDMHHTRAVFLSDALFVREVPYESQDYKEIRVGSIVIDSHHSSTHGNMAFLKSLLAQETKSPGCTGFQGVLSLGLADQNSGGCTMSVRFVRLIGKSGELVRVNEKAVQEYLAKVAAEAQVQSEAQSAPAPRATTGE